MFLTCAVKLSLATSGGSIATYSTKSMENFERYCIRFVDLFDLHIHIDEIPAWCNDYTIG